jgi:hypothetical protein
LGEKSSRNGGVAALEGIVINRFNWRVIYAVALVNYSNQTASAEFRVVTTYGPDQDYLMTWSGTLAPGQRVEFSNSRRMRRPGFTYYEIKVTSGIVWVENINLWGIQV